MNFYLKNIELAISENLLLIGEKLLDTNSLSSLHESERNLWVAIVSGFEVEMQITPTKVKACSCECSTFQNEKMCGHIVAGLMELRKRLSQKKLDRKKKKAAQQYSKLTTNAILEQIDPEELKAFVRHFARKSRQFSIALQTRFASAVPLVDNHAKYRQVIDTVLKGALSKNNTITVAGSKQLLTVAEDLLGQAIDAIALEHYTEAWAVLYTLLDRVVPTTNKVNNKADALVSFSADVYHAVDKLVKEPLSPDLRETIWDVLLKIAVRPSMRGYDLSVGVLKILEGMAADRSKCGQFLEVIEQEEKKSNRLSESHNDQLLVCRLSIFGQKGFKKHADKFFKEIENSPELILKVVEIAKNLNQLKSAKSVAERGLQLYSNALFQYRIKSLLIEILAISGEYNGIVRYAKDCYIESGKLDYLKLCKSHCTTDWEAFKLAFVAEINAQQPKDHLPLLANLYVEEEDLERLGELLLNSNNMDLLIQFDQHFIPKHSKLVEEIYQKVFDKYFSTHFGIKPTQKLLTVFAHLRKIGADQLVSKLAAFVRKNHPERLELAMELMTL